MTEFTKKSFSVITLLLLSVAAVIYIYNNLPDFKDVLSISPGFSIYLLFLLFMDSVVLGLFNKVLLDSMSVELKFREWYGLSIIANLWNYIIPFRGGALLRAYYLKRVHAFSLSDFLGSMLAMYFISFLVNSLIGLSCLVYIYEKHNLFSILISSFFLMILFICIITMYTSPEIPSGKYRIINKISSVLNSWNIIKKKRKVIFQLSLVILAHAIIDIAIIHTSFMVFSIDLAIYQCILLATLFSFSILFKITPGSIGTTEAIMVFGGQFFQITPAQCLMAAGIMRILNMMLIFTLGPIFSYILGIKTAEHTRNGDLTTAQE